MLKKILSIFLIAFGLLFITCCSEPPVDGPKKECQDGIHQNTEWIVVLDSTCSTLGRKEQKCTKCHAVLTTAIVDYKEHKAETIKGTKATCEQEGLTDGTKCSVCNTIITEQTIIPALNHNYVLDEKASTDKILVYKCEKCQNTYEKEVNLPCETSHTSGDWITTKEATCTEYGSAHKVCNVCGIETEVKTLPLSNHKEEIVKGTAATCEQEGLTDGTKCSVCNKTITEQTIIPALDHNYVLDEQSSTDKKLVYKCENCQKTYEKEVDLPCEKNHTSSDWITTKEPTCTEYGSAHKVCNVCGIETEVKSLPLSNHKEEIIEGTEATCEKEGHTAYKICSDCKKILEQTTRIPALDHNYVLDEQSSTDKILVYKCENCLNTYEKEVNLPCETSHTSGDWITTKESTCAEYGSAHKVCNVCGIETEIKTLPLSNHKEEIVKGTAATCEKEGLTDGTKCSVCNKIITEQKTILALDHDYKIINTLVPTETVDGYIEYSCSRCNKTYKETIKATGVYDEASAVSIYLKDNATSIVNNNSGVLITGNTIKITLAGEYDIYGELTNGSIIVSVSDTSDVILNLRGVKLTSNSTHPIYVESGNKVEISAKADTINYINDKRSATTTDVVGGAIYSLVDLELKGKGTLYVTSTYNNALASTKDLEIKNLTLEANAPNNAIKGNDSITIESGTIKAISSSGDALKTENSDISTKGNQRGIITILGGTLNLYAACDGIDASYDCIINGGTINIYTEKYSSYSGDATETTSSTMYLRVSSRASGLNNISKYSAMFITESNETKWEDGTYTSANGKKYYKFNVPTGVSYVKFYAYSSSQQTSQSSSYAYVTDQHAISPSYDTYYVNNISGTKMMGSWENFNSPSGGMGGPGGGGGMGGPMEGNPNSSTYSCKGIKADNSITINNGTINIKSHDDGIHTNSDVLLDNGSYGIASLTISGGNITVHSDDDGLHADSNLTVNGGNIIISNAYEGLEGNNIYFKNGTIQIKSLDDGINAKSTLYFQGSTVYLDAGGDGIDSNGNVYMTAGIVLALGPTNGGNGVIDYGDRNCTFSFSGGLLVAVGCSGMNAKPTASSGNTVSATTTTAPSVNSYLTITSNGNVVAVMKVTKSNQNYQVLAYNNTTYPSTSISVTSSTSVTLTNGLYYVK